MSYGQGQKREEKRVGGASSSAERGSPTGPHCLLCVHILNELLRINHSHQIWQIFWLHGLRKFIVVFDIDIDFAPNYIYLTSE